MAQTLYVRGWVKSQKIKELWSPQEAILEGVPVVSTGTCIPGAIFDRYIVHKDFRRSARRLLAGQIRCRYPQDLDPV